MIGDSKNIIACDLLIIGGGLAAATAAKCALQKDIDSSFARQLFNEKGLQK